MSQDTFQWSDSVVRLHFRKIPVAVKLRVDWHGHRQGAVAGAEAVPRGLGQAAVTGSRRGSTELGKGEEVKSAGLQ